MSQTSSLQSDELQLSNHEGVSEELISLGKIQSLPYVVREIKNEENLDLCDSINEEGLKQPLVVSRHPDSEHYVLVAGGNTRLEIIQRLHHESKGSRFREICCVVVPWPGTCAAKVYHLITNEVLHSASFIERAKAVLNFIEVNTDLPINRETSDRGVSKFFTDHGYPLYRTIYATMKYAVDFLNTYLPMSLASSLCALDVHRIRKLERKLRHTWTAAGKTATEFNKLFTEVARSCDHEDLDYETFHHALTEQVWDELQSVNENSSEELAENVSNVSNQYTIPSARDADAERMSCSPSTSLVPKGETSTTNDLLEVSSDKEPCEQIRSLALELARKFGVQDCISLDELGEFGFLVVDLPSEEASPTARLVWEYLANFSGVCELSKAELMPCLSQESKLHDEFQKHETSPSLEIAKEIDLSVMWTLDSDDFELLLLMWRLVFEHTQYRPNLGDKTEVVAESDSRDCVAA